MKIYGTENNETIMKELGKRIQDTRIAMSYTQAEMSKRAGVSPRTVERIEHGENVKVENVLNVLRSLNLIGNIDLLVNEQEISPEELFRNKNKRMRASSKQKEGNASEWKWGEDR